MNASNIIIGITGGLATGKSTVCEILKRDFKYLTSADAISHRIMEIGMPAYKKIVRSFGVKILNNDRTINRKLLAQKVFLNQNNRKLLESIMHPIIISTMKTDIMSFKKKSKVVLFEAPLLFEAKMEKMADIIIVVSATLKNQVIRFMKKGHSRSEALKRIKAQMPLEKKVKKAHVVIYNNSSIKNLEKDVSSLAAFLKNI